MKCTTCQQTNFKSIHGRVFCADCGTDAARRLRSFQTYLEEGNDPSKINNINVLDLTQQSGTNPVPAPQYNSQPANQSGQPASQETPAVTGQPSSISGIVGPVASVNTAKQPGQTVAPVKQPEPAVTNSQVVNTVNPNPSLSGVNTQAADNRQNTANTLRQPANNIPATTMQPHQTYRIKEEQLETSTPSDTELMAIEDDQLEPRKEKKSRSWKFFSNKLLKSGAVALSMVLLTGYITYLNYPNIAVRVAANRAGIEAGMPGYLPSGYGFSGPITYSPGQLSINFRGDADGGITLTQSTTKWDSRSLLENYVKLQSSTYETYHENGLTIYAYDGRHAAWVNRGTFYKIETKTPINTDDIVKMASSL